MIPLYDDLAKPARDILKNRYEYSIKTTLKVKNPDYSFDLVRIQNNGDTSLKMSPKIQHKWGEVSGTIPFKGVHSLNFLLQGNKISPILDGFKTKFQLNPPSKQHGSSQHLDLQYRKNNLTVDTKFDTNPNDIAFKAGLVLGYAGINAGIQARGVFPFRSRNGNNNSNTSQQLQDLSFAIQHKTNYQAITLCTLSHGKELEASVWKRIASDTTLGLTLRGEIFNPRSDPSVSFGIVRSIPARSAELRVKYDNQGRLAGTWKQNLKLFGIPCILDLANEIDIRKTKSLRSGIGLTIETPSD